MEASGLAAELEEIRTGIKGVLERAREIRDFRTELTALGHLAKQIELKLKIAAELKNNDAPAVNLLEYPEWIRLRTLLFQALEPFGEARLAERAELPGRIAAVSTEGKRLVETASNVTGPARRLLDAKLQEVGEQLGRLEARYLEVQRRLALLARMVRAVVAQVEVDEPNGDVRAFMTDLGPEAEDVARAIEVPP